MTIPISTTEIAFPGDPIAGCPIDTNIDVEAARDREQRSAIARELRDCIAAALLCPTDLEAYSPDVRAAAEVLAPLFLELARLRNRADDVLAGLETAVDLALDYLVLRAGLDL